MASDFIEYDPETPSESDLDQAYGSKFLTAAYIGDRKIHEDITKIRKEDLRGKDGKKRPRFILYFKREKPLVLNPTNQKALVEKFGRTPAKWIGAHVVIFVDPNVSYGTDVTGGVRLRVLGPPPTAKPSGPPEPPPHDGSGIEDMSDSIPI